MFVRPREPSLSDPFPHVGCAFNANYDMPGLDCVLGSEIIKVPKNCRPANAKTGRFGLDMLSTEPANRPISSVLI